MTPSEEATTVALNSLPWANEVYCRWLRAEVDSDGSSLLVDAGPDDYQHALRIEGEHIRHLHLTIEGASRQESQTEPPRYDVFGPKLKSVTVAIKHGTQAKLRISGQPSLNVIRVEAASGKGVRSGLLDLEGKLCERVEVQSTDVRFRNEAPDSRRQYEYIAVSDGVLELRSLSTVRLRVSGSCGVEAEAANVGEVAVTSGARLLIRTSPSRPVSRVVVTHRPGRDEKQPEILLKTLSALYVNRLEDVDLVVAGEASIHVLEHASDLIMKGAGHAHLRRSGERLELHAPIKLSMAPYAQATSLRGWASLGNVAHASLSGHIAQKTWGRESSTTPDGITLTTTASESVTDLQGVSISGARFPISLAGLRTIAMLRESAHTVSPIADERVPGQPGWQPLKAAPGEVDGPTAVDAAVAQALADLSAAKGASSAARSKLSWGAYNLRQQTSASRWERCILRAYRLIGYGELFAPPFVAFLLASLAATIASLGTQPISLSSSGLELWGGRLAFWLTSPLHLVDLGGEGGPEGPSGIISILLRALIAIPFVTFVLTLRRYVKVRPDVN